jgi:hypothetical protein
MHQPARTGNAVVGEPVSPSDQMWLDAAADLTPDKSVARIEDNAKYLLGGIAVIGTLITGLGVFTSNKVASHPVALLPTVVLTAASLAAAALALVPHGESVSIDDVAAIKRFYQADIRTRGRLVQAAGVLFGLALLATSIPAVVISAAKHPAPAGPYVSADLFRKGNILTLVIQVHAVHLAPDGYVTTDVSTKAGGAYLIQDRATADASGAVNESASTGVPGGANTVQIVSAALSHGKTVGSQRLTLGAR